VHPLAVSARGVGEYRHLLAIMLKSFTLSDFATLATLVDGEQAAVHWRAQIHSRITGTAVLTEFMVRVQMREGRIAAYTEFFAPR